MMSELKEIITTKTLFITKIYQHLFKLKKHKL